MVWYLKQTVHYNLFKPALMKKSILLTLSVLLLSVSLSAQIENNKPLIVINGKISSTELNSIDPDTIESITVLKDQSATAAYGELGMNGVILIITKDYVKPDSSKDQKSESLIIVNGEVYTSELNTIDPNEIEAITVLKDKSATDIYGEAGKNGVVLITTTDNNK